MVDFKLSEMSEKWLDEEFVIEQFNKHIEEVKDLFNNRDSHLMSEVVDLLAISTQMREEFSHTTKYVNKRMKFWDNISKSNYNNLIKKRYNKFLEKAKLDKKEA